MNNYSAVVEAVKVVTGSPFQLSPKRITISTVGDVTLTTLVTRMLLNYLDKYIISNLQRKVTNIDGLNSGWDYSRHQQVFGRPTECKPGRLSACARSGNPLPDNARRPGLSYLTFVGLITGLSEDLVRFRTRW